MSLSYAAAHATDVAEIDTAVAVFIAEHGKWGFQHVVLAADAYWRAMRTECEDCASEPPELAEPFPGATPAQRSVLTALAAGPRVVAEIASSGGWSPGTAGSVLAALRRRGLVAERDGLWWRQ